MLTPEKAAELVDPNLSDEQKVQSAQVLVASSAAYDAYLDSRPQLEQIISRANGGGEIPSHDELNGPGAEGAAVARGAAEPSEVAAAGSPSAGAIEGSAEDETAAETDAELVAAEERVKALRAQKGA